MFKEYLPIITALKKKAKKINKNIPKCLYMHAREAVPRFNQALEDLHSVVYSAKNSLNTLESVEHDLVYINMYLVDLIGDIWNMADFIALFIKIDPDTLEDSHMSLLSGDNLFIQTLIGIIEAFEKMSIDLDLLFISENVAQEAKNNLHNFNDNVIIKLEKALENIHISKNNTLESLMPSIVLVHILLQLIKKKLEEVQKKTVWHGMDIYSSAIKQNK